MKTFPMFLRMTDRPVVIVGGGEQAAQKCRLMLKTEARIIVAWPELEPELFGLAASGRITWEQGAIGLELFEHAALVFVATGCPGSAAAIHAIVACTDVPVNVVDQPELCTAITPSLVDRDPVVVAIGTEGTAPVLARQIKSQLETTLEPRLGEFAALAGRLRAAVAARVPQSKRRAFWRWAFDGPARALHRQGAERDAADVLKAAITAGKAPDTAKSGSICLVGAGPGAADLMTLRAVQRLQEADVIFYDRLVSEDVLELARRDAERVFVGKDVGANAWPQDRINDLIVSTARQGKRVVRLKGGDPMLFGRAEEELAAARQHGIDTEVVPGITAASASAAALQKPLTERGSTDRLVLATGACRPGDAAPDVSALLTPGTAMALYMAVNAAERIQRQLLDSGCDPDMVVDIVQSASRSDEKILSTTVAKLTNCLTENEISHPAIMMIRRDKQAEAARVVDLPLDRANQMRA